MYEKFFGLSELPFSIAPNPRYLYMSKYHHEALAHLLFGVKQDGGFILLTGEVGTGKTTVCRCFLEKLPDNCHVAVILNSKLSIEELLETLCDELGIPYVQDSISVKGYLDVLNNFLLKAHAEHKKVLLIIDEAQNLSIDVLEQIRLLTNLETDQRKLLQIVLIGQPELRDLFEEKVLRQLAQRITARYHLPHLSLPETDAYIRHRLEVAGCSYELFPKSVVRIIFKLTDGIPRLINVLCDRALLGAYASGQRYVDKSIMRQSAREVMSHKRVFSAEFWKKHQWWLSVKLILASLFFAVALLAIIVQVIKYSKESNDDLAGNSKTAKAVQSKANLQPVTERDLREKPISTSASLGEAQTKVATLSESMSPPSKPITLITQKKDEKNWVAELERQLSVIEEASPPAIKLLSLDNYWEPTWPVTADFASALYFLLVQAGDQPVLAEVTTARCQSSAKDSLHFTQGLQCFQKEGASVKDLQRLPLPFMLTLFKPGTNAPFHAVVTGLNENAITLQINPAALKKSGLKQLPISWQDLSLYWQGQYTLVWRVPPGYYGPIEPGTIGPVVKWLSQRLGELYNDPNLEAGISQFNEQLVNTVKKFQAQQGLTADGVVGPSTLIQLHKAVTEKNKTNTQQQRGG
jgi:general secretion pathway protein A